MRKHDHEKKAPKHMLLKWLLFLILVFALPSSLNYLRDKQIQYMAAVTAAKPGITYTPPLAPAITPQNEKKAKSIPKIDYENPPIKQQ